MTLNFFQFKLRHLAVISLTVVFLLSIYFGMQNGKERAHSEAVVKVQEQLQQGLANFFSDQDRYPSLDEFGDSNILLQYFYTIPKNESFSKTCPSEFVYKRFSNNNYELDFCLEQAVGTFTKGWNQVLVGN